MTDDLVARLRDPLVGLADCESVKAEAADEIERLRAQMEGLNRATDAHTKAMLERDERAEAELTRLRDKNAWLTEEALGYTPEHCRIHDELRQRAEKAEAENVRLKETWTDDSGATWTPPTAWAYAQVCAAVESLRTRVFSLIARAERAEADLAREIIEHDRATTLHAEAVKRAEKAEAERDALRQKIGRMRRALRLLNKAHAVLWKVIGLRNDFHAFAVADGSYIKYRAAIDAAMKVAHDR